MSSFDNAAYSYDVDFTDTIVGRLQRDRVWRYLDQEVPSALSTKVLELNCGTGEDAIYLATKGHDVLATDISIKMIEQSSAKIESKDILSKITVGQLDMSAPKIPPQIDQRGKQDYFDLVFSNFGGINCLDKGELKRLSSFIKKHLSKDGSVIMVVMPRYCLIDLLNRIVHLDFKGFKKRLFNQPIEVMVDGSSVSTYYYSPNNILNAFEGFVCDQVKVIGVMPSYLESIVARRPVAKSLGLLFYNILAFFRGGLSQFSDHYLIQLSLKNQGA